MPPPPCIRDGRAPRRSGPAALALALALTLGAGGAAAQQTWCEGTAVTGRTEIIICDRGAGDPNPANVHIIARNPNITRTGFNDSPITSHVRRTGIDVTIEVTGGSLTATGNWSKAINVWHPGASGDVDITLKDVDLSTEGLQGGAVYVFRQGGAGTIDIDVSGGSITTTGPTTSQGILGLSTGSGDIDIDVQDVVIKTAADNGLAIYGVRTGATGNVDVDVRGGAIETTGFLAHGVMAATVGGTGNVDVSVSDASIVTRARFTRVIAGAMSGQGDITVGVSGGTVATSEGEGGVGVYAVHSGDGSSETTIGAGTRVRVPFANGVYGRMTATANAAGRVVITSGGAIEARDAGILAWVEPRSGSTFGDGEGAAGAARTAPMIHVISSGDVTVGASVMDAYVRAAIAGDDGTLSVAEQAVFDAIVADDSDALDTALGALPAAYTDAWKARARGFRTARGAKRTDRHGISGRAPATAAREAEAEAVEILQLPRTGIRAMALSHVEIADHVRVGDVDPAITAIAEASRTTEQKATLAAQQMLSAAERTVLAAVLTGGDLDAALAALPAAYTDAWKDGVQQRALAYNDGDIRVEVTGGTITAEGDGVHARYVLTHDRNGAIAVSVDEGATVSGERNGLYVGGAGLAAGNDGLRDQTVTVNGAVMGGTGAGVHLAGGGTVTVGRTGRVGATSGVGILSDGPGDLVATVAGAVDGDIRAMGGGDLSATVSGTVDGDLRAEDGGALTVDVKEGGAVTGTVHDPAGPLMVHGSIGRLLYASGGTVTVSGTGRLTGVEGESEAVRSEAGDLTLRVAGTVAGDLRAPTGGALTLSVMEGGAVTGTAHDPVGPLTVHGSIGRLLYASGGTVTVSSTGRLTSVEGKSEAVRSAAGDLSLTVAGMVSGDVRALGDGDLTAMVSGRVDGGIEGLGAGEHRVTVARGGTVTGAIHLAASVVAVDGAVGQVRFDNGGTVTVAATGRITGVTGEADAIRSAAGDLSLTVAGTVSGDVRALGDGDLTAMVSGLVDGGIEGLGAGEHTVMVTRGGTVTGAIHLAASAVAVDGAVGQVRFDNGGAVTVGGTGRITGIEGVAVRNAAGALSVTAAPGGRIEGDIVDLGDRPATIATAAGSTVTGTIDVAGADGAVTVGGAVGRVRLDGGGMVTVGANGRVAGIGGDAITSERGDLGVVIQEAPGETPRQALGRISGAMRDADGGPEVRYVTADGAVIDLDEPGSTGSVPDGAFDVGVVTDDGGGIQAASAYAPRSRVYEALPSVLLGLNGPSAFRDRLSAPRSSNGVWALVEAEGGERAAKRSTSAAALSWDYRRRGVRTGLDVPLGSGGVVGVSAHHRHGSADLSGREGEIEASGNGLGVSAAWGFGDGFYVDGQLSGTWYDVDLKSSRGTLKSDARGFGYALGVEAGRRLGVGVGGATVTPRAGVVRSRVYVKNFTDGLGNRVSLEKGGSVTGRAGVSLERDGASGARLFGSVDVEREFSDETRVIVSGTGLSSEADATRVRVALGGSHEWGGGRYAARGGVSYAGGARGNRGYGAALGFEVRF